jgi:hypothetical protein
MVEDKISFTLVTGSTLPKTKLLPKKVISGELLSPNTIMFQNVLGSLDKNTNTKIKNLNVIWSYGEGTVSSGESLKM